VAHKLVPPRPAYRSQAPSQELIVRRNQAIGRTHKQRLDDVDRLARSQQELGEALSTDIERLQDQGQAVEALDDTSSQSLLDAIVRRFTRRRQLLERRSATQELVSRYETVSTRLRRASAFTDELRLTALELQAEVQELHADIDRANHDARLAARRVLELEQAIDQAVDLEGVERDRVLDTLRFELRQEGQNLQLFKALAEMCQRHVEPARALRDTVQRLHEEMQSFVLAATGTVDAAGRRIQALGAAADAPVVVEELRRSLDELQDAMRATETYLSHTRKLIAHTLPELSARISADTEAEHVALAADVQELDRARAHAAAERELRLAALDEVNAALDPDSDPDRSSDPDGPADGDGA